MNYLIFSDESGDWNSDGYYIRAWIKILNSDYQNLIDIMKHINQKNKNLLFG